MRTKQCLFCALVCIFLCSCSSNEYKFYKSTTATLVDAHWNPFTGEQYYKEYKIAVDVYAKKGEHDHYKIRNSEGIEYDATRALSCPSEFETWDGKAPFSVCDFRHGNVVGDLFLPF